MLLFLPLLTSPNLKIRLTALLAAPPMRLLAGSLAGLLAGLMLLGCQRQTLSPTTLDSPGSDGAIAPKTASQTCISNYEPEQDYFPDKIDLDFAEGFRVTYHKHYKRVIVSRPWKDADTTFEYLLVQCGTPIPTAYPEAQVVQIPVQRIVALSTTHLPHLDLLNAVDRLQGVSDFAQVNTPSVRQRIEQGELEAFYSGSRLELERLLLAQPDLITTYGTGNVEQDSHPRLIQAGLSVAIIGEYLERSLLGRAEWLKFTALFLNQEAKAQTEFAEIARQYQAQVDLVRSVRDRPTVFTGFSYNGTWYMPGNENYMAQLLRDAGANYLWQDLPGSVSHPLDFEAVFGRAKGADFWLNASQDWQSPADAIAADARYGNFLALQQGQLYSPTARLNETGGNDYWESGVVNPQIVLADLIKIFHPELLPDHELFYYQPISRPVRSQAASQTSSP